MEWIKITPNCFEQYKDSDKYLVLIYGKSDVANSCSYDLIYWDKDWDDGIWTTHGQYPSWPDRELYEYYTHYAVIEEPEGNENGIIINKEDGDIDPKLIYYLCYECTSKLETTTIMMPSAFSLFKPKLIEVPFPNSLKKIISKD